MRLPSQHFCWKLCKIRQADLFHGCIIKYTSRFPSFLLLTCLQLHELKVHVFLRTQLKVLCTHSIIESISNKYLIN